MSLIFLSAALPLGFLAACEVFRLLQCKGSGSGCVAWGLGGDIADSVAGSFPNTWVWIPQGVGERDSAGAFGTVARRHHARRGAGGGRYLLEARPSVGGFRAAGGSGVALPGWRSVAPELSADAGRGAVQYPGAAPADYGTGGSSGASVDAAGGS